MRMRRWIFTLMILGLPLMAYGQESTATPTETPTATMTHTPTMTPTATPTRTPGAHLLDKPTCLVTPNPGTAPGQWEFSTTMRRPIAVVIITNLTGQTAQISWNRYASSTELDCAIATGQSQIFTQEQLGLSVLDFVSVYLPRGATAANLWVRSK